jgi:acyl-CoA reductase-like NAD-dependent aldehyde dehydrogenase
MYRVLEILEKAGLPHGVLNIIQGTKEAVEALLVHPTIQAVTFVGSSPVAKIVATTCRQYNKRVTALGGAKNHLVTLPDSPIDATASDITVSFAGCAGQRCMAASVLLTIGSQPELIEKIVTLSSAIEPGQHPGQMGPVIDTASYNKILSYIQHAEENDNVKILLDGRKWSEQMNNNKDTDGGYWIGPTILLHKSATDKAITEEIFGPVLSVYECSTWEEAVAIENANPFGNAASIYTTNGANADWFLSRFRAAMLGTF